MEANQNQATDDTKATETKPTTPPAAQQQATEEKK
jgi:hypothetical protein